MWGYRLSSLFTNQSMATSHNLQSNRDRTVPMRRLRQLQPLMKQCIHSQTTSSSLSLDSSPSPSPTIRVSPEVSRYDEKVGVQVSGVRGGRPVTVQAVTQQVWRRQSVQFVACGHYVSSDAGHVDLTTQPSLGGTYIGVEPMGLFWSMVPQPAGPQDMRLVIKEVDRPLLYTLSVHQGHLSVLDLQHSTALTSRPLHRYLIAPGVRRVPVREGPIRGTLFLPPGEGRFPGILDMFGMAGGLMEFRASLLASHGFAALSLAIYNYEDLPTDPREMVFSYFEYAVKWFSSHSSVAPGGIGMIGVSGGAGLALMMAYYCPEIKAFVRINGVHFHHMMNGTSNGQRFSGGLWQDTKKMVKTDEGHVLKDVWKVNDKHLIPLWEKDVHTLAIVSDDDQSVNGKYTDALQALYPAERRHLIEVVHYPGAGHLLEPPYTPHCRACYNPYFVVNIVWGGNVNDHARAQEDSWQRILQHFRKHIPSAT